MIGKLLKRIDEEVLGASNQAVRAYNYVTGGERADLANRLLDAGTIGMAVMGAQKSDFITPLAIFGVTHLVQRRNKKVDKEEIEAAKSGCQDFEVEKFKDNCKIWGYAPWVTTAIFASIGGFQDNDIVKTAMHCFGAISLTSLGASYQVMRADYLPPKKNCVSRAKDKLTEMIAEYKLRQNPSTEPMKVLYEELK